MRVAPAAARAVALCQTAHTGARRPRRISRAPQGTSTYARSNQAQEKIRLGGSRRSRWTSARSPLFLFMVRLYLNNRGNYPRALSVQDKRDSNSEEANTRTGSAGWFISLEVFNLEVCPCDLHVGRHDEFWFWICNG